MIHNRQHKQFSTLFLFLVFFLITLPLFLTSQDMITKLLDFTGLSYMLQHTVIPIEVKFLITILSLLGIPASGDLRTIVLQGGNGEVFRAQIIWSCIGWQSVVLVFATLYTGLKGNYTFISKMEVLFIGLLGTFWVNIFRILLIYLFGYYFGKLPAVLFHNFAGTIFVVAWLFAFWWFSYRFILEEKRSTIDISSDT